MTQTVKILFLGDLVGRPARKLVKSFPQMSKNFLTFTGKLQIALNKVLTAGGNRKVAHHRKSCYTLLCIFKISKGKDGILHDPDSPLPFWP